MSWSNGKIGGVCRQIEFFGGGNVDGAARDFEDDTNITSLSSDLLGQERQCSVSTPGSPSTGAILILRRLSN
jgi:hypothetical protein